MYDYLTGQVTEKTATTAVVEVHGVGYRLLIPVSSYERLPPLGGTVKILTYFAVREDAQVLYGFMTEEERRLFKLLLSVSGIGPKSALTVLSGITIAELKRAIAEGSVGRLQGISGIGKKTAERIVVELKEKMVFEENLAGGQSGKSTGHAPVQDAVEALVALGYRKQNAKSAVEKVLASDKQKSDSLEGLIRESLKVI